LGPCIFVDADCDGDFAGDDFALFPAYLDGPGVTILYPLFDDDEDGDIDLRNFAALQTLSVR
jgi:hypothetical protein